VESIVFPDATATVITGLDAALTEPVSSRVPNPRPATFVTVQRAGGPRRNIVTDEATLIVESWAATPAAAHDLAQNARATIHALLGTSVDGVRILRTEETSGPAYLPDPDSQQARYTQTFSVALR
jgi:hypothetical protein